MTIHSSSGFTIMELDGGCGHLYSGIRVVRRQGYMIASNADVFHSSDCAVGATIENSTFEANLDDFVNTHSTVHVGWTPSSVHNPEGRGARAAGGAGTARLPETADGTRTGHAVGATDMYIIQPRNTATSESVNASHTDDWYGTASPMAAMRPGDTISCWVCTVSVSLGVALLRTAAAMCDGLAYV